VFFAWGLLAQAKNGDQLFWEVKFHAANGKAPTCTQGALLFFLLCFGGLEVGEEYLIFFLGSQCVPTMFTLSSQ